MAPVKGSKRKAPVEETKEFLIPTHNNFAVLAPKADQQASEKPQKKTEKPPPIFLQKGDSGEKEKLPIYILITPTEIFFRQLQGINIYYHKVQIRKFVNKRAVTQCYRC
jgi:hypothetical protein